MRKIIDNATSGRPPVNLLVWVGKPDYIYSEVAEIALLNLLQQSCIIASVEGGSIEPLGAIIGDAAIGMVVGGVAIAEAVSKQEIDGCALPCEIGLSRCRFLARGETDTENAGSEAGKQTGASNAESGSLAIAILMVFHIRIHAFGKRF